MTGTTFERIIQNEEVKKDYNQKPHNFYRLIPQELGCEVSGIDLKEDIPKDVIEAIKEDTTKHRILVFKNQGDIDGARQVEIAKWFGEPNSPFDRHPKAPNRDIFRISNDITEGLTQIGICWHVDATFMELPFGYSLYHMVTVPKDGPTLFVGLSEIVEGLSHEKRGRWERLYMCSDRHERPIHPLIYTHPLSKKMAICYNSLMIEKFIWDYGKYNERATDAEETQTIIDEVNAEFNRKEYLYTHMWEEGEFVITDNLSLGHEASYESMKGKNEIGLRVLHRVSTKGVYKPTKEYDWPTC